MEALKVSPEQRVFNQTAREIADDVKAHARYSMGRVWPDLPMVDVFMALGRAVRDRVMDRMVETEARCRAKAAKRVHYFSIEFLIGRSLATNLQNLGMMDVAREAMKSLGYDLEEILECENDAALGNGGLGRLAACFLDSLASLDLPATGYGILYDYGLFRQTIENGFQLERPDSWLINGSPWTIERTDESFHIPIYGKVIDTRDDHGNYHPKWVDSKIIVGVPHDMPIVGYGGRTVNVLRLYSARSIFELDLHTFNQGDYIRAFDDKLAIERVSKVLYPSDAVRAGKELRLMQEYFLVACAIRDVARKFERDNESYVNFSKKAAIQLNDTHPALAIAELMRLLIDEKGVNWDTAWEVTRGSMGYTNHTLLPEALEKWPISLLETVLPRHLQIIYEINHRFLKQVSTHWLGDSERIRSMSLIEEGDVKQVRMAHLAILGSHSINGVSKLHSDLVKSSLVPDFYQMFPHRFNNKTNGVSQRRWMLLSNPELSDLITEVIGDRWILDLEELRGLEKVAEDSGFQEKFMAIKRLNKERLARVVRDTVGVKVDPKSVFDIHAKRFHEYKRQLLCVMNIIHEYLSIVDDGYKLDVPKTYVFAGKAAPGYWAAKQIIKLVNNVADVINNDVRVKDMIKVAFIPDYRVSLAQRIFPAADLSEQISTAGKEASGTGNMKFGLNGALTIGTLDGANIEMRELVGHDNIFIFGNTAEQIEEMKLNGSYSPRTVYQKYPQVRRIMDAFKTSLFCPVEPNLFNWVFHQLVDQGDTYFHLADLPSYIETHAETRRQYQNRALWAKKAILNVARLGWFSSDRTIRDYARDIWHIEPVR